MKKIIKIFFISIIISLHAIGQSKIDSLKKVAQNTINDTTKIITLNKLVQELRFVNMSEALFYSKQALQVSNKIKSSKFIGISLNMLARSYFQLGDSTQALKYGYLGLQHSKVANDISNQITLLNIISLTYEQSGSINKAISTFQEAINIARKVDNKHQLGALYNNIGNSYKLISDYPNATKSLLESLKITELINDVDGISACYSGLGEINRLTKNHEQAIKYYLLGAELNKKTNDLNGLSSTYNNLGITYMTINDNGRAKSYYDSALVLLTSKLDNPLTKANIYQNYGILFNDNYKEFKKANTFFKKSLVEYSKLGSKYEETISLLNLGVNEYKLNDFRQSIYHLNQAEKQAKKLNLNDVRSETYKTLSEVYESLNQANMSLSYYKKYATLKDTLFSEQNIKDIAKYRTIYETERKEKEVLQKNIEIEKQKRSLIEQRIWIFGVLAALLILGTIAYLVYKNYKRESILNQQLNVLNGELVHRTKNQLQLLISFLNTQERTLNNSEAKTTIQESKLRISAIGLVNEKLNKSQELINIDLQDYILELVNNLKKEFQEITVKELINVPNISIDAIKIARIGLIINELVTNSYKYAFRSNKEPILNIEVLQLSNQRIKLIVKDNGTTLNNINFDTINSTGLKLVKQMIEYLEGNITVSNDNGTTFEIEVNI